MRSAKQITAVLRKRNAHMRDKRINAMRKALREMDEPEVTFTEGDLVITVTAQPICQ